MLNRQICQGCVFQKDQEHNPYLKLSFKIMWNELGIISCPITQYRSIFLPPPKACPNAPKHKGKKHQYSLSMRLCERCIIGKYGKKVGLNKEGEKRKFGALFTHIPTELGYTKRHQLWDENGVVWCIANIDDVDGLNPRSIHKWPPKTCPYFAEQLILSGDKQCL